MFVPHNPDVQLDRSRLLNQVGRVILLLSLSLFFFLIYKIKKKDFG